MAIQQAELEAFLGKAVCDMGAAVSAALVFIGDQLGLYKAIQRNGPLTPEDLAKKTGTAERYVREWLANQAASGYVTYDAPTGRFSLTEVQAAAFADEESPAFLPGGFQALAAMHRAVPKMIERFKDGKGLDWGEQDPCLFEGTERFFRPGYAANLVSSWLPALDGVKEKLERGARVADVGCGLGASTILMAKAFPRSQFVGFDAHPRSIELARKRAAAAKVGDRVQFEVATAASYPGTYDFVANFDCLHDMGDPIGAAKHVRESLAKDGTWMIVEPFANDKLEDNLNPIGRIYYGASTLICVPASLAHEGAALGAQAGEARLRDVVRQGGFTRFRRATETPFNLILEARP